MSEFETLARPYCRAIFDLAKEQDQLDYWSDVLELYSMVASDIAVIEFVGSPEVSREQAGKLFIEICENGKDFPKLSQETKNLILLLAENERLLALPAIKTGFEQYKQEVEGVVEVQVTTARKLTGKQEKALITQLQKKLGKEVTLTSEIDKTLIAGVVVRAGDLVIDGTARGRLDKMMSLLNK